MRILLFLTLLTGGLYANESKNLSKNCSEETIKRTYGYAITSTRPVPGGPAGQIEQHIGVGVREYDGKGNFSQVDTTRGSMTAPVIDNPASGTYMVKSDCTGTAFFTIPGLAIVAETRFVVVNKGKEIRWIVINGPPPPSSVMVSGHAVRQ